MFSLSENNRGFSLIELALVLVVTGVFILSGGWLFFSAKISAAENITKNTLREARITASTFALNSGVLPDISLFQTMSDGYGEPILIYKADGVNCGGLNLIRCSNTDCSDNVTLKKVALIMVSAGENRIFQTENTSGTVTLPVQSTEYDDKAEWLSFSELPPSTTCGSPPEIRQETLPPMYAGSWYEAVLTSDKLSEWCAESEEDTAVMLNISTDCSAGGETLSGYKFTIKGYINSNAKGTAKITVHAKRGSEETIRSYIITIYPMNENTAKAAKEPIDPENILNMNEDGLEDSHLETDVDEAENSLEIEISPESTESVCVWLNSPLSYSHSLRIAYAARLYYTDSNVNSTGSDYGGFGLAIYPASLIPGADFTCGLAGTASMGYGNLPLGPHAFVLEHDLYPDVRFDYLSGDTHIPKNHAAFVSCERENYGKHVCLGMHSYPYVGSCPDDSECSEPGTSAENWLEDNINHAMRLELRRGYADGCTVQSGTGRYIKAMYWTECVNCSNVSEDYNGSDPDISGCFYAGDAGELNSVKLGFTTGGKNSEYIKIYIKGIGID
jgi:prepilin-type N-terminal cleavage/methylation domain-containing protein